MIMTNPVIFIHYGNSEYLGYSLMQAKIVNKNSDVILIGDDSNNCYPFITHINVNDNSKSATEFAKLYKHMSPNAYDFELICFQRWFILRDFMIKYGLNTCYYQDSDVLLYTDINEANFSSFHLVFTAGTGSSIFINNFNTLCDFCSYIEDFYVNKSSKELESIYQERILNGISDMTLFLFYYQQYPDKIFDLSNIVNESVFDFNINCSQGFETWFGRKKIYLTNEGIFGKHIELDKLIRLKALHFQGVAKPFIKYFAGEIVYTSNVPVVFDYAACRWVSL